MATRSRQWLQSAQMLYFSSCLPGESDSVSVLFELQVHWSAALCRSWRDTGGHQKQPLV